MGKGQEVGEAREQGDSAVEILRKRVESSVSAPQGCLSFASYTC